ncbi:MAG: hypothetical protein IH940_02330 [Acidobacteria bacterium]|nr:hypothetical protein [Acidobacteriota bacterium]
MSVPIALDELDEHRGRREGPIYLLTVRDSGPRACSVQVSQDWHCPVGAGTRSSLTTGDALTLLWGMADTDGFALIVDAEVVAIDDSGVKVGPTSAVLHQTRR